MTQRSVSHEEFGRLNQGTCLLPADTFTHGLRNEIREKTSASDRVCEAVAERISQEVQRICQESDRIQASGDVTAWARTLGKHRLDQCLRYYHLGSRQGRINLHSTLSAIVYRYMTTPPVQSSYPARIALIEDFLQGFYVEALNAFRRENQLADQYQPRTLLELAEYMAFTERYGKRRIALPRNRSQQLIVLRAQTFARQQPPELAIDITQVVEAGGETDDLRPITSHHRIREELSAQGEEPPDHTLRDGVVEQLLIYLKDRDQEDCADYFTLRLMDLPTQEIEALLGLTPRQRDYLQQRFRYHLSRFALSHHWQLVHEWLGVGLETNLGLTPQQWQQWQQTLTPQQADLLHLKQIGMADGEVAKQLALSTTQLQKQWTTLLAQAWEIRNL
ncbi:MAG: heterocyst differentiation protein HetZ [Leptolyngbya sp.]|nr:heterocyst differentiation protein HetZ [Leptolyngbya sp.]